MAGTNDIKQYNVQSVGSAFCQDDVNIATNNVLVTSKGLWGTSYFFILSGFEDNGDGTFSPGTVVMNGIQRYSPNNINAGLWLEPVDVQTDERLNSNNVYSFTYTSFQCQASVIDTGFPQITANNIAKYRGSINGGMIQLGTIEGVHLEDNIILPDGTTATTQPLTDDSQLVATTAFVKGVFNSLVLSNFQLLNTLTTDRINTSIIYNNELYFAGENGTIIKTSDGVTFFKFTLTPTVTSSFKTSIIYNNSLYFAGTNGLIFRTTDGVSFTNLSISTTESFNTSSVYNTSSLYFAGTNGVSYRSLDGVNFNLYGNITTTNINDSTVYLFNNISNRLYYGGDNGTLTYTSGGSFFNYPIGQTANINKFINYYNSVYNTNSLYFICNDGIVRYFALNMLNAATTNTTQNLNNGEIFKNLLYIAGDNGTIIKTTNGIVFTPSVSQLNGTISSMKSFSNALTVCDLSGFYCFSYDGVTFSEPQLPLTGSAIIGQIIFNGNLYLFGDNGKVAKTWIKFS